MRSKKEITLKVDPQCRIGVDDVIVMLKELRNQTFFEIVRTSENLNVKNNVKSFDRSENAEKSKSVTGNTDLPQIRELNEIASILRSMGSEKYSI